MSDPLFSVLIANYNNGRFIDDAIASVQRQTYSNWEIIIVDDASTDQSLQVLEKYKSDSRIKIYTNDKNYGCGYTKRRCAELAAGEICGFLDPDDALSELALILMVEAHNTNPDASMVYSRMLHCNDKLEVMADFQYQRQIETSLTYLECATGYVGHFVSFKKHFYLKTEGINPEYKRAVDQDLYFKLEEVGRILFIDHPLYLYRQHTGSISLHNNKNKALAWGLTARVDACRRRGISVEDVLPKFFEDAQAVHEFYQNSKDYRLGLALLKPVRWIKGLLRKK